MPTLQLNTIEKPCATSQWRSCKDSSKIPTLMKYSWTQCQPWLCYTLLRGEWLNLFSSQNHSEKDRCHSLPQDVQIFKIFSKLCKSSYSNKSSKTGGPRWNPKSIGFYVFPFGISSMGTVPVCSENVKFGIWANKLINILAKYLTAYTLLGLYLDFLLIKNSHWHLMFLF